METILISILLLIALLVLGSFHLILFWTTHISQVKDENVPWDYANFNQFLEEFNKRVWERDPRWPTSWFGIDKEYPKNQIHASIIKFDGKGMILRYPSYIKFQIWLRKNRLFDGINLRQKNLWIN